MTAADPIIGCPHFTGATRCERCLDLEEGIELLDSAVAMHGDMKRDQQWRLRAARLVRRYLFSPARARDLAETIEDTRRIAQDLGILPPEVSPPLEPPTGTLADLTPFPGMYLQRRRTAGSKLPPGTVNCTRPSPHGNPFVVGSIVEVPFGASHAYVRVTVTPALAVLLFQAWVRETHREPLIRRDLHGLVLSCYCAPGAWCHVQQVLLPIANDGGPTEGAE